MNSIKLTVHSRIWIEQVLIAGYMQHQSASVTAFLEIVELLQDEQMPIVHLIEPVNPKFQVSKSFPTVFQRIV